MTWILLVFYLILVLAIGLISRLREDREGFLISDRSRSGLALGSSITVGWIGGGFLGYFSSTIYTYGWAPIVAWCCAVTVGYFLLWIIVSRMKSDGDKFRLYMLSDFYSKKYSRRLGFVFLFCNFSIMFAWLVAQFVVGGQIISSMTKLSYINAIVIMTLITGPYLILGGFKAVLNTDIAQIIILGLIVLIMAIFGIASSDGGFPSANTAFSMGTKRFYQL